MPTIRDENGEREISNDELGRLSAAADERWSAFCQGLTWRPIAEYDRGAGAPQLLRAGDQWAFGFWGARRDRAI